MRHTHASLLLAMRIPVSTVSARLGHSSTTVTEQVYTHFVPAADEAAADAWAERSMAAKPKQPGR
jgi:integrase